MSMSCKALAMLARYALSLSFSLVRAMSLHRRAVVVVGRGGRGRHRIPDRRRSGVPRFVQLEERERERERVSERAGMLARLSRDRDGAEREEEEEGDGGGGDVVLHLHCLLNDSLQIAAL